MTQEEKQLLLQDLCARLPYGVRISIDKYFIPTLMSINLKSLECGFKECSWVKYIGDIKPYLRPMSSMTVDDFGFLQEHLPYDFTRIYSGKFDIINDIHLGNSISIDDMAFLLDYLDKYHFDYRGLIEKGLAIEAPEGMYNTKTE